MLKASNFLIRLFMQFIMFRFAFNKLSANIKLISVSGRKLMYAVFLVHSRIMFSVDYVIKL